MNEVYISSKTFFQLPSIPHLQISKIFHKSRQQQQIPKQEKMLKNPFLNTAEYTIPREWDKFTKMKRSVSNFQSSSSLYSSSLGKFRERGWAGATGTYTFGGGRGLGCSGGLGGKYEHLRGDSGGPGMGRTWTGACGIQEPRYSAYYPLQIEEKQYPDRKKTVGQQSNFELQYQHKKKASHKKSQQKIPPCSSIAKIALLQKSTTKVSTLNKIEYYQYSCSDSKQPSQPEPQPLPQPERRTARSISMHSHLRSTHSIAANKQNSNPLASSYKKVQHISDPIQQKILSSTNTNLSASLCNIKTKARANRYSSYADLQSRGDLGHGEGEGGREKGQGAFRRSMRKKCSVFQGLADGEDDGCVIMDKVENDRSKRVAKEGKSPSKFSNFYNKMQPCNPPESSPEPQSQPQSQPEAQSEPEPQQFPIPPALLIRNKIFYLCKNHSTNGSTSYTNANKKSSKSKLKQKYKLSS